MSLSASLTAIQSAIIANMTDYTTSNCTIHDEAAFAYIQSTVDAPTKCAIVSYEGMTSGSKSEFSSVMVDWKIIVNAFFMIVGDDYMTPINDAIEFADDIVMLCATNSTLGGSVMRAKVIGGSEPLVYARASFNYILVSTTINVMDNIGG